MSPWIETIKGTWLDVLNPTVEQARGIGIAGYAYGLCYVNRFTGWVGPYSVAHHSLNVARCVKYELGRPDLTRAALWHDAAEVVTNDLSTPFKRAIGELCPEGLAAIREITRRHEAVIAEAFDVRPPSPEDHLSVIKEADVRVCRAERERYMYDLTQNAPEREADWEAFYAGRPAAHLGVTRSVSVLLVQKLFNYVHENNP